MNGVPVATKSKHILTSAPGFRSSRKPSASSSVKPISLPVRAASAKAGRLRKSKPVEFTLLIKVEGTGILVPSVAMI